MRTKHMIGALALLLVLVNTGPVMAQQIVSGKVRDCTGFAISGVSMTGFADPVPVTDVNGNFLGIVPDGDDVTIIPEKAGISVFFPAEIALTNVLETQADQNFAGGTCEVSGSIEDCDGVGIAGVVMTGFPGTDPVTNANGDYIGFVDVGIDFDLTPDLTGFTFAPVVRVFNEVERNKKQSNHRLAECRANGTEWDGTFTFDEINGTRWLSNNFVTENPPPTLTDYTFPVGDPLTNTEDEHEINPRDFEFDFERALIQFAAEVSCVCRIAQFEDNTFFTPGTQSTSPLGDNFVDAAGLKYASDGEFASVGGLTKEEGAIRGLVITNQGDIDLFLDNAKLFELIVASSSFDVGIPEIAEFKLMEAVLADPAGGVIHPYLFAGLGPAQFWFSAFQAVFPMIDAAVELSSSGIGQFNPISSKFYTATMVRNPATGIGVMSDAAVTDVLNADVMFLPNLQSSEDDAAIAAGAIFTAMKYLPEFDLDTFDLAPFGERGTFTFGMGASGDLDGDGKTNLEEWQFAQLLVANDLDGFTGKSEAKSHQGLGNGAFEGMDERMRRETAMWITLVSGFDLKGLGVVEGTPSTDPITISTSQGPLYPGIDAFNPLTETVTVGEFEEVGASTTNGWAAVYPVENQGGDPFVTDFLGVGAPLLLVLNDGEVMNSFLAGAAPEIMQTEALTAALHDGTIAGIANDTEFDWIPLLANLGESPNITLGLLGGTDPILGDPGPILIKPNPDIVRVLSQDECPDTDPVTRCISPDDVGELDFLELLGVRAVNSGRLAAVPMVLFSPDWWMFCPNVDNNVIGGPTLLGTMAAIRGSLFAFSNTGDITDATGDAVPIEITSAAHGLTSGQLVNIDGVGGNDAANGTFAAIVTGADTFALFGSLGPIIGDGDYTFGGSWVAAGTVDGSGLPTLPITDFATFGDFYGWDMDGDLLIDSFAINLVAYDICVAGRHINASNGTGPFAGFTDFQINQTMIADFVTGDGSGPAGTSVLGNLGFRIDATLDLLGGGIADVTPDPAAILAGQALLLGPAFDGTGGVIGAIGGLALPISPATSTLTTDCLDALDPFIGEPVGTLAGGLASAVGLYGALSAGGQVPPGSGVLATGVAGIPLASASIPFASQDPLTDPFGLISLNFITALSGISAASQATLAGIMQIPVLSGISGLGTDQFNGVINALDGTLFPGQPSPCDLTGLPPGTIVGMMTNIRDKAAALGLAGFALDGSFGVNIFTDTTSLKVFGKIGTKDASEPFSGGGFYNPASIKTNAEISQSLEDGGASGGPTDFALFVQIANNPGDPSEFNPALPAIGLLGLGLLAGIVSLGGAVAARRRRS